MSYTFTCKNHHNQTTEQRVQLTLALLVIQKETLHILTMHSFTNVKFSKSFLSTQSLKFNAIEMRRNLIFIRHKKLKL